eukprot:CAMPEP_0172202242 /NCGR_PEP_ID=MMETSP1050-20130122/30522_1 /TAXON_ID=233186 /ORGANISM="Cryptomonas curvata, Strain CCAP979/52" /LENGTH=103 /DNA_ID=CAMNT_0012880129 /DNA_START=24 /DNA_END=332 /DNA_ORIENTATION=+
MSLLAQEVGWLRKPDKSLANGIVSVTSDFISFKHELSGGNGEEIRVRICDITRVQSSKQENSKLVAVQIKSSTGDLTLDFAEAGSDAARRRDAVREAVNSVHR